MSASDRDGTLHECLGELIGSLGQLDGPKPAQSGLEEPGLNRTIEGEIIPRLMMLFDRQIAGAAPALANPREPLLPGDLGEFVRLVLENDVDVICNYVEALRDGGVALPDIYLSLLAPAARELGTLWEQDECSFTAVTLGVSRMHQVILRFSPCFSANEPEDSDAGHSVLIIPTPGEQHTFGLLMLVEFFRREGWNVWNASPASVTELSGLVESRRFDVVGCSLSAERNLAAMPELIRAIRERSKNKNIKVIVGGRLFSEEPGLADKVGADATAQNGMDAVRLAGRLVQRSC